MRLFIAINLAEPARKSLLGNLGTLQDTVRTVGAKVKWVPEDQLHLTLKFLGESPDDSVPKIREALEEAVDGMDPFSVILQGFGCFPLRGMPHVLWIGTTQGKALLDQLAQRIDEAFQKRDIPQKERTFHAHLTVARIRFVKDGKRLRNQVETMTSPIIGPTPVTRIDLMQSVLKAGGPEYTVLHQIPL